MRKAAAVLLAGALLCSAAGCSSNLQQAQLKDPDGTLKVYYVIAQNNTDTRSAIDKFAKEHPNLQLELEGFSNSEEMDNRISTEMNSGQGPDVMIVNANTSLDINKMMMGKNLLDMNPWLQKDSTFQSQNYYPILDAGVNEEKQLVMPLGFGLMFGAVSQTLLREAGIQYDPESGGVSDFLQAANAAAEWDNPDTIKLSFPQSNPSVICSLLTDAAGYSLVDMKSRSVEIPAEFHSIVDLCRQYRENMKTQNTLYQDDFVGRIHHNLFHMYNLNPLVYTKLVDTACAEGGELESQIFALPSHEDSGKYRAMAMEMALINANTKNANAAYQLVRYLMDYDRPLPQSAKSAQQIGLPINRSVLEKQLETTKTIGGQHIKGADGMVPVLPLSEEHAQFIMKCISNVSSTGLYNQKVTTIVEDCMGPYINGVTSDYEGCVRELENKLKLYVNE